MDNAFSKDIDAYSMFDVYFFLFFFVYDDWPGIIYQKGTNHYQYGIWYLCFNFDVVVVDFFCVSVAKRIWTMEEWVSDFGEFSSSEIGIYLLL